MFSAFFHWHTCCWSQRKHPSRAFYYQQPIIDGLIAARKQYYYLSFFLFAVLLSDRDRIRTTLDLLSLLALALFFLGLVNYFVHPIFNHKWAEGQGIRGGIVRGYIPGMQIIVLACIWQAYKLVKTYQDFLHAVALRNDAVGGSSVPPDTRPSSGGARGDRPDAADQQALEHSAARRR